MFIGNKGKFMNLSYNSDLNWLMRGYDGEFNLIRNYSIKCIEADDNFIW